MRRSRRRGFRFVSECPYQYPNGSRAFVDICEGAVVAEDPKTSAGVEVWMGVCIGVAERAPGSIGPP